MIHIIVITHDTENMHNHNVDLHGHNVSLYAL